MRWMLANLLILLLLLTGCRLPSMVPHAPSQAGAPATIAQVATLSGRLGSPRQVMADYREFAKGATVSLIDAVTGYTAATTVTDDRGKFAMVFDSGFAPVASRLYYLEAIKGIKERGPNTTPNGTYNQAGADAIRLRTFIFYEPGAAGWTSPYNPQPGPIFLSRESTALALSLQLKQELIPLASTFVGCLDPVTDGYQEVAGLSAAEFTLIRDIVYASIAEDRDPIHFLAFDTSKGTFVNVYKGHFVSGLDPAQASVGDEVLITGDGFDRPGLMVVHFYNQATASVIGAPSKSAIRVKVPVGARIGPVTVTLNGMRQLGPEFKAISFDGHRSMLDGILYVANNDRRMIVRVLPDGTVEDFAPVADGPTQVLVHTDRSNPSAPVSRLFVACADGGKVVTIDVATRAVSDFALVARPTGMAFLRDVLYVANAATGEIARFKLDKTSAGAPYLGFTNPTALAFGYDYASGADLLYVAELSNPDRVTQLNLGTAVKTVWAYRTNPMGLAVDSAGAVYVAAYEDNMVYRILPSGALMAFARVPAPSAVMLDESGVMYVASDSQHQIYRVSPLGDLKPYAYGINDPRGLATDGLGNLYVSLSRSNAILKVEDAGAGSYRTTPFLQGIANPHGITWRNDRLYIAHQGAGVLTSADANGALRTEASGLKYPGGADVASDGNLYVGRYGASVSWEYMGGAPGSDYSHDGGLHVLAPAGALTTRRPILVQRDHAITGLDDGTRFAIHYDYNSRKALIMYASTNGADSSYRYRILYDFPASPRFLERNETGNCLFVTLSGDSKIYRFKTPGLPRYDSVWTMDTITGLTAPGGMSYDKDGHHLYVLDNGSIKRISDADGAAPSADKAWGSVTATSATDLAFANNASHANTLFVTFQTLKEVRSFSVAATPSALTNPAHTYIKDLDVEPQNILAHPSNGEIYVRASNSSRAYRIATNKLITMALDYTGHSILRAMGLSQDGTFVRADNHYGRVHGKAFLHGLVQSHEVAAHGDWIYVGSHLANEYAGVHAFNVVDGSDMFIRGFEYPSSDTHPNYAYRSQNGPGVLAANPTTNRLYAGNGYGQIYEIIVDGSANHGKNALWTTLTLGDRLYGMDLAASRDKLWIVGSSRNLYAVRLNDKNVTTLWAGLSRPRF